jgi:redox-sensitive bicupin YhaK (pirin superfamily)
LQIWIVPSERGIAPSYEQKAFSRDEMLGRLRVVASPDGRDGSVTIHADAVVHVGLFGKNDAAELALRPGRGAWVQIARGKVAVNGRELSAGDGASLSSEPKVDIKGVQDGEVLVFDLA